MKLNQKEINYLKNLFLEYQFKIETDILHYEEGAESLKKKLLNNTTKPKNNIRVTNKMLADYLGVTEQAVKQYPKIKNNLMKKGLLLEILEG